MDVDEELDFLKENSNHCIISIRFVLISIFSCLTFLSFFPSASLFELHTLSIQSQCIPTKNLSVLLRVSAHIEALPSRFSSHTARLLV